MNTAIIIKELTYKAVRSSGAGGQHVNKVSSKIELSFRVDDSKGLSQEEKLLLNQKLSSRITKEGKLIVQCGDSRSQHKNKDLAIKRLLDLVKTNLHIPKTRRPTRIPKAVIKKRLENKKKQSFKKANRRKPLL